MDTNPNLNEYLGIYIELFCHAWVQKDYLPEIVIYLEPYDRDISADETRELINLIELYSLRIYKNSNPADKPADESCITVVDYICNKFDISFPIMLYRNYYKCPSCKLSWNSLWNSMCDDDCPKCGTRHISPFQSSPL